MKFKEQKKFSHIPLVFSLFLFFGFLSLIFNLDPILKL